MGGYEASKYYEKQEALLDRMLKGEITRQQFLEEDLKNLDDELGWSDGWLAAHYNSTAEYLVESVMEGNDLDEPFEDMVAQAEKEIAVFRKHNDTFTANMLEGWLNEAKEAYAEAV